jgi:diacylglycerol kinase (ATP)
MSNSYKSKAGLRRIWNAWRYSLDGLRAAYRHEAAFRQELAVAVVLIALALWLPVNHIGKALMIGSVLLALAIELLNSAIETTVDRISLERNDLAKRAKDIGSAAVLTGFCIVIVVWALVLTA